MSDWIDLNKELPPCDGMYDVTNDPSSLSQEGCLYYDGFGFSLINSYSPVKFWRKHNKIDKRYGKIK